MRRIGLRPKAPEWLVPNEGNRGRFRRSIAGLAQSLQSARTSAALFASMTSRSPGIARCMAPGSLRKGLFSGDPPPATSNSELPNLAPEEPHAARDAIGTIKTQISVTFQRQRHRSPDV